MRAHIEDFEVKSQSFSFAVCGKREDDPCGAEPEITTFVQLDFFARHQAKARSFFADNPRISPSVVFNVQRETRRFATAVQCTGITFRFHDERDAGLFFKIFVPKEHQPTRDDSVQAMPGGSGGCWARA